MQTRQVSYKQRAKHSLVAKVLWDLYLAKVVSICVQVIGTFKVTQLLCMPSAGFDTLPGDAEKVVLSAWQTKMDSFACVTAGGQQKPSISLAQTATGFQSVSSNKGSELITLQRGSGDKACNVIQASRAAFMAHFCAWRCCTCPCSFLCLKAMQHDSCAHSLSSSFMA